MHTFRSLLGIISFVKIPSIHRVDTIVSLKSSLKLLIYDDLNQYSSTSFVGFRIEISILFVDILLLLNIGRQCFEDFDNLHNFRSICKCASTKSTERSRCLGS